MTDKEKINKISSLCLMHIGDKSDLVEQIQKIIKTNKKIQ